MQIWGRGRAGEKNGPARVSRAGLWLGYLVFGICLWAFPSLKRGERWPFSLFYPLGPGLVDCLVGRVAAHFADGVFEHYVLLEEVVYGHFTLGVVVHRALEEEREEALCAVASGAGSEVAQEHEVEAEGSGED